MSNTPATPDTPTADVYFKRLGLAPTWERLKVALSPGAVLRIDQRIGADFPEYLQDAK